MKFFKKSDLIVIGGVLIVALAFFLIQTFVTKEEGVKAEIYYYSQLIEKVDLEKDKGKEILIPQNENVIIGVDDEGRIAFISSDCPDKLCVKTGKLHLVGQYAACLPNGIIVKIVQKGDGSSGDADIIIE